MRHILNSRSLNQGFCRRAERVSFVFIVSLDVKKRRSTHPRQDHSHHAADRREDHVGRRDLRLAVEPVIRDPHHRRGDEARDAHIVNAGSSAMPMSSRAAGEEMPGGRAEEALHRRADEEEGDGGVGGMRGGERVGRAGEADDEEPDEGEETEDVRLYVDGLM